MAPEPVPTTVAPSSDLPTPAPPEKTEELPPVTPAIPAALTPPIVPEESPVPVALAPAETAVAPTPTPVPAEPRPPAPPTGVEIAAGDSLVSALGGFLDATAAGHRGVCVVRETPERIRARVGSRPIEVYWISNIGRGPSLRPADLDGLWALLRRKLVDDHDTAFFFEGIEYLVRLHGVDAVLTGMVEFDRLARENDARVWVYLTPALMKPSDIDRFRSTFGGSSTPG